jgi:antitoxin HigA-1
MPILRQGSRNWQSGKRPPKKSAALVSRTGARYFKNTAAFWMNLQTRYDLEVAEDELADKVERDVQPLEVVSGRQE